MSSDQLMKLGIALGIVYAVYRFAPGGQATKAAAAGVIGVIVAKQTPYVKDVV